MDAPSRIPILRIILALGAICGASAQAFEAETAAKVKAAYLLNFARFSTWSDAAFDDSGPDKAPLVIAVLGEDSSGVADILARLVEDKTVHDRPVSVRRFDYPRTGSAAQQQEKLRALFVELNKAHLLHVDSSLKDQVTAILRRIQDHDVLTVSDSADFASGGGMLGLVQEEGRIIFEANTDVIDESQVKVSSKILKLARIVRTKGN